MTCRFFEGLNSDLGMRNQLILQTFENLARVMLCRKAPVIFERSERPALRAKPSPTKKRLHRPDRFFAPLKKDGCPSACG